MKVITVEYSKVINLGNYENEKIGLMVELEDGETPSDALLRCRAFVRTMNPKYKPPIQEYQYAKDCVLKTDDFSPNKIRDFQDTIDRYELTEVPF